MAINTMPGAYNSDPFSKNERFSYYVTAERPTDNLSRRCETPGLYSIRPSLIMHQ